MSKVKELLSKNKRLIYARDSSGICALHKAAKEGNAEIVKHVIFENPESTKITDNVSCFNPPCVFVHRALKSIDYYDKNYNQWSLYTYDYIYLFRQCGQFSTTHRDVKTKKLARQ